MPSYFSYFWDQRTPYAVKAYFEKRSATLFQLQRERPLTYTGAMNSLMLKGRLELTFQASTNQGLLYSLGFEATTGSGSDAERAFQYWLSGLNVTPEPGAVEFASGDRYETLAMASLKEAARLSEKVEDPRAIAAAQQAVLVKLRAGKYFARGHHDGITTIRFEGTELVVREAGESPSVETCRTEPEMLKMLRLFFDYEASKGSAPHKPPEVEIWKYIESQLRQG